MLNQSKICSSKLLLIMAMLFALPGLAQMKKGEKLFSEGKYAEAVRPLKKEFEGKNKNQDAGILLAKCYYQLLDYQEALDVISVVDPSFITSADDRRFYADVLVANDDYSGAYISLIQLLSDDQYDPKSNLWLDKVEDLMAWDTVETNSSFTSIQGMNSVYNEYAPYYTEEGEIWFVNDITNIQAVFPSSYNNQNMHLYYKTSMRPGSVNRVSKPSMLIKNKDYYYHDGPLDEWTGQGKYALTLRDLDAPIGGGVLGIYFSEMTGSEDDVIPFKYNEKYNTGHPTFTRNGTRMIFASDRPGGFGQMDLWYSDWKDGTWTEPKNMGPTVNTPYNEVFPNYAYDRLFFSSNRQDKGYGGLDIYYASEVTGYSDVYNLRAPVNGPYDDFGPSFMSATTGLYASNRKGGSGGDDIYRFEFHPAQTPIEKCKMKIVDPELADNTEVQVFDSEGNLVSTTTVNADGKLELDDLKSRETYTMKVSGADLTAGATLLALNGRDEVVRTFAQTSENTFKFELLPTEDYGLEKQLMVDDSELIFDINGKIVAEDSVDVNGVPVSLVAASGAVVATVETDEEGAFTIAGAKVGEDYTLETEGMEEYHEIDVYGTSGAITQSLTPMGNNQFAYTRAAPAAMWMTTAEIVVPSVFGIILENEPALNESVILYDEQDSILSNPKVDEDGFITFGSLVTGKAYRLNLEQRDLTRDNRLVILDGNGDTSQTVRPFDAHNYFFEYLIYSDYGAAEEGETIAAAAIPVAEEPKSEVFKMRVVNFRPDNPVPFVLIAPDSTVSDTMYINSSGVAVMRNVDPDQNYTLALTDTVFGGEKKLQVFDSANKMVYEGQTGSGQNSEVNFLKDEEYTANAQENDDDSILSVGFAGNAYETTEEGGAISVYDSNNQKLGESYLDDEGVFRFKDLKPDDQYVVTLDYADEETYLKVFVARGEDSLRVDPGEDGYFYVNFEGESITLVDNNQKEVTVSAGTKFELDNIYYDFNSFVPKTSSRPSMDKLVEVMNNNPNLRIEIQSHTDSHGPANYNKLLSQKRAKGVVDYLVSQGIDESRLVAVGMGESQLTNKCADGVRCPISEHAKNRRTEFVILANE